MTVAPYFQSKDQKLFATVIHFVIEPTRTVVRISSSFVLELNHLRYLIGMMVSIHSLLFLIKCIILVLSTRQPQTLPPRALTNIAIRLDKLGEAGQVRSIINPGGRGGVREHMG